MASLLVVAASATSARALVVNADPGGTTNPAMNQSPPLGLNVWPSR